jgi:aldehyde dehydrogenase (NAD+)
MARTTCRQRIERLERLHAAILRHTDSLREALWKDFRKGVAETDISEISVVTSEIRHTRRHLYTWMWPRPVGTPLALLGSRSEVRREPKGVSLIIAPWNYPVQLALVPLVSAIAAGNCAILKPSEFTPHSAAVLRSIVESCFPAEEVAVVEGGVETAQALLQHPFDHIFFTGSPAVGRIIMAAAAKHLSSVTLELGGKSPVVIDETADLDTAAAKVAWIKAMNGGQICIAPDYVLVHEKVHDAFVQKVGEKWEQFYGKTPESRLTTPDFCRIINDRNFDRLGGLVEDAVQKGASVRFGGRQERSERYLEMTVLTEVDDDMAIMQEEIFGPILPIQKVSSLAAAVGRIRSRPKPLAMYIFSHRRENIEYLLNETSSGNVSVNDCAAHYYNTNLPFGGTGNSGIGKAHGEFGFLEFTNQRGILHQNRIFPTTDLFMPPYGRPLMKWLLEGVKRWF